MEKIEILLSRKALISLMHISKINGEYLLQIYLTFPKRNGNTTRKKDLQKLFQIMYVN